MTGIGELLKTPAAWLSEEGDENEMVLSSRVRLARNLDDRPFTHIAPQEVLETTLSTDETIATETGTLGRDRSPPRHAPHEAGSTLPLGRLRPL